MNAIIATLSNGTTVDHAALYAAHSWRSFAVQPNDKRPLFKGWQNATYGETMAALEAHPNANLGLPVPPGHVVLDVDIKSNGPATLAALEAEHAMLPDTLTAITPTGGKHLWFSLPPGIMVKNRAGIALGLDVRTAGGYVVVAPSIINGKSYRWKNWDMTSVPVLADVPTWLLDLMRRPMIVVAPSVQTGKDMSIPEGLRNDTLFKAGAALRREGFSHRAIATALDTMNAESCKPPLAADELKTIAASAYAYARRPQPWEVFSTPGALPAGASLAVDATGDTDPLTSLERNLVSLDSLSSHTDWPMPHYVEKWIPHGEVTLLAGHGGSGKSYVALNIAVHVALGRPFGPLATTQATVVYFSAEDGASVLRQRLARLCSALTVDPTQLKGKLHLLDASDIDPALHREQRGSAATETALLASLAVLVQKLDVGLVIIDNSSDTYDDDEIKRAHVRTFVRSLRSRLARPGRAVLLLTHVNKATANRSNLPSTEDYSGSTAWHNSVRSRLSLIPIKGEDALTIEHAKANLGERAGPVRLEWHDGVPLVAGYTPAGAEAAAAIEKKQDDTDKGVLVALIQSFDARGESVTASAQGPATVYKLLKGESTFPKNTTSERLMRLLRELENESRIYRRTVRTPNRKTKEVFTCTLPTSN